MKLIERLPPGGRKATTNWDEIVEILHENPGQWGNVGEYAISQASQMRQGSVAAFLPRKGMDVDERREWMSLNYEIQYRRTPECAPNRAILFVRYVGP